MWLRLRGIVLYFLFWIFYFITLKILFVTYFWKLSLQHLPLLPKVFLYGIRLDMSATGYIVLLPILLLLVSVLFAGGWFKKVMNGYTLLLLLVFSILATIDLASYSDWGSRLDASTLFYASKPKEAVASVSLLFILVHLTLGAALVFWFYRLYTKRIGGNRFEFQRVTWYFAPLLLILFGCMVFPIRGGMGTAPINVGSTYFSTVSFMNHAAINLPWNFGFSITNLETVDNPYQFMEQPEANRLVNQMTQSDSTLVPVLRTRQPNIILIILESFTANATGCLQGSVPVTPNLDRMAHEGILFTNMYASGSRTDKGMIAILSAFPAQPTTSIIKFPNKTQKLPSLPHIFHDRGYSTEFYYGGDIEFANYQSYLLNAGFEKLHSMKDFPGSQRICSWGVPDEFLFQRVFQDICRADTPYFKTLFTLSSHAPYDVPMPPYLEGDSQEILFCNSMYYTDFHLGKFIDSLEHRGKLENTLLICIADHGSTWPGSWPNFRPEKFHIPMIWYGPALSTSGIQNTAYACQTDIAATLLSQMGMSYHDFRYSRNLFSADPPTQCVYAFNNGFGMVSDSLVYYYEREPNRSTALKGTLSETNLTAGKAYLQTIYNELIHTY